MTKKTTPIVRDEQLEPADPVWRLLERLDDIGGACLVSLGLLFLGAILAVALLAAVTQAAPWLWEIIRPWLHEVTR